MWNNVNLLLTSAGKYNNGERVGLFIRHQPQLNARRESEAVERFLNYIVGGCLSMTITTAQHGTASTAIH